MFSGNVVGSIGLTVLGPILSRKKLMLVNLLVGLCGLLLTIFCQSLLMAAIGLFLSICGVENAFNASFDFIAESMSDALS